MKKFDKVISVEVSVDNIANKLLNTFPEDYAHRELLTETVIGTALASNKLGYVYNALHGFNNDINFEVGQVVNCTASDYFYEYNQSEEKWKQTHREIGKATIVEIDVYQDRKIKVEFDNYSHSGTPKKDYEWVYPNTCTQLIISDPLPIEDEADLTA